MMTFLRDDHLRGAELIAVLVDLLPVDLHYLTGVEFAVSGPVDHAPVDPAPARRFDAVQNAPPFR